MVGSNLLGTWRTPENIHKTKNIYLDGFVLNSPPGETIISFSIHTKFPRNMHVKICVYVFKPYDVGYLALIAAYCVILHYNYHSKSFCHLQIVSIYMPCSLTLLLQAFVQAWLYSLVQTGMRTLLLQALQCLEMQEDCSDLQIPPHHHLEQNQRRTVDARAKQSVP